MCGIAGWLGCLPDAETYAARLQQAMRHRGPDGHGAQLWADAGLVHTRLSILDLSPAGAQPITNEDGTVWAVFNGEIYNHKEIRRSLEARGHKFKGHSDSEVLPHLYEEEGLDFVRKLRGMFALAIYDTRSSHFDSCPRSFRDQASFLCARVKIGLRLPAKSEHFLNCPVSIPDPTGRQFMISLRFSTSLRQRHSTRAFGRLQPGEILEARLDGDGVSWKTRTYHRWSIAPDLALTLRPGHGSG